MRPLAIQNTSFCMKFLLLLLLFPLRCVHSDALLTVECSDIESLEQVALNAEISSGTTPSSLVATLPGSYSLPIRWQDSSQYNFSHPFEGSNSELSVQLSFATDTARLYTADNSEVNATHCAARRLEVDAQASVMTADGALNEDVVVAVRFRGKQVDGEWQWRADSLGFSIAKDSLTGALSAASVDIEGREPATIDFTLRFGCGEQLLEPRANGAMHANVDHENDGLSGFAFIELANFGPEECAWPPLSHEP